MPLQNRSDPFGALHAVPARGMFTGNRGVIHDPATRSLAGRRWTTRAWIVCACAYKGRRRDVMGRNGRNGGAGWTEIFFLDEVTALATGHRPCFTCRRRRAADFLSRFATASGIDRPKAPALDARLHRERVLSSGRLPPAGNPRDWPDGTMATDGTAVWALRGGKALPWSFDGYGAPLPLGTLPPLRPVTPATTRQMLAAGYEPAWHESA